MIFILGYVFFIIIKIVPSAPQELENIFVKVKLKKANPYGFTLTNGLDINGKYLVGFNFIARSLAGFNERIKLECNTDIRFKQKTVEAKVLLHPFGDLKLIQLSALHIINNLSSSSSISTNENKICLIYRPKNSRRLVISSSIRDSVPSFNKVVSNEYKNKNILK